MNTFPGNEVFDITIIGGGPTGLYAAYYAGLRGLKTKIIDSLSELGGQLVTLYPEKYIYDVAGFPRILARDLASNLIAQGLEYHPTVCLGQRVLGCTQFSRNGESILELTTDDGVRHSTRTLLLTSGVGAFTPKKLNLPLLERFEGKGLIYYVREREKLRGRRVLIVGGGDSAVDWALHLSGTAASVTLIHRREQFRAHEENVARLRKASVEILLPFELRSVEGEDVVAAAVVENTRDKTHHKLEVDVILLSLGFHSSPGPLKAWGLALEKNDVKVNSRMESNISGIYAAGDIAAFPGKLKLISTGFGEAAIAVNSIKNSLDPAAKYFPGHSADLEPPPEFATTSD